MYRYIYIYSTFYSHKNTAQPIYPCRDFPADLSDTESACQAEGRGPLPELEGPLEEEMATFSSIPAWAPGGLQSRVAKCWTQLSPKQQMPKQREGNGRIL